MKFEIRIVGEAHQLPIFETEEDVRHFLTQRKKSERTFYLTIVGGNGNQIKCNARGKAGQLLESLNDLIGNVSSIERMNGLESVEIHTIGHQTRPKKEVVKKVGFAPPDEGEVESYIHTSDYRGS